MVRILWRLTKDADRTEGEATVSSVKRILKRPGKRQQRRSGMKSKYNFILTSLRWS
jgi:hypothetical protein